MIPKYLYVYSDRLPINEEFNKFQLCQMRRQSKIIILNIPDHNYR